MSTWRLLDTGMLPASLNMGIDQALLQLHARGHSPPTLRFYQWHPPAISLGYFQRQHTFDLAACRSLGIDVVRRPTGGRAVLHQGDLTYGLIAGIHEGIPSSSTSAYRLLCAGLLKGFRSLGIEAELGRERVKPLQPDVCFLRFVIGDIIHQGKKFAGNAQMWCTSSLLQHGSIILEPQEEIWGSLLAKSSASFDSLRANLEARMTSLQEASGRKIETGEVKAAIKKGMAETLGVAFEPGKLSPEEWALAQEIAERQVED
jgi:lipoate-protein ligase A